MNARLRAATARSLLAACLSAAACSPSPTAPALGPDANRCARLVGFYLGVEAPVEVAGGESDPDTRKVRIDYRTMDLMNAPLEGVALCRFRDAADGKALATDAFVDENRLRPDEIEAFNEASTGDE